MTFQIDSKRNWKQKTEKSRVILKKRTPWLFRLIRIAMLAVGLFLIWLLRKNWVQDGTAPRPHEILLTAFYLLFPIFTVPFTALLESLAVKMGGEQGLLVFDSTGLTQKCGRQTVQLSYKRMAKIYTLLESDTSFYLMCGVGFGREKVYMIPKDAFVEGTPDDFRAQLRKKTGLPIEKI